MFCKVGSGFGNLCNHMITCAGGEKSNGEQALLQLYYNKLNSRQPPPMESQSSDGNIRHFVLPADTISQHLQELHGWLRWIVMKDMPLDSVQDKEHCPVVKFKI
jgi:hypothetical protein